jgi:hypothetical protein
MRAADHSEVIVTSLMSNSARSGLDQHRGCPSLISNAPATVWLEISSTQVGEASAFLSTLQIVFGHSRSVAVSVAGGLGKWDHPPLAVPRFGGTRCFLRRCGHPMRGTGLTNRGKGFGYRVLRDLRAFAARSFTLRLPRHVVE